MGLTSPPSSVLCSATTATCPSRCPMLSLVHRYLVWSPTFVSFLQARWRSGTFASTPGLLGHPVRLFRVAHKETSGSPKFPDYPLEYMPRSSTVRLSSRRSPGGVLSTRLIALRTTAFHPNDGVGFPTNTSGSYPLSTTIQISRLNHAACTLVYPGFGLPLPD